MPCMDVCLLVYKGSYHVSYTNKNTLDTALRSRQEARSKAQAVSGAKYWMG